MTDGEFVFMETQRERSDVKKSAWKKKSGKCSKKCKLGVDGMSNKEIESMHGPIVTWKMTDFYSWDEFKQMPDYVQIDWLNGMIKRYDITRATVAEELFGITPNGLADYLKHAHILNNIVKCPRKRVKKENLDRFRTDILLYWEKHPWAIKEDKEPVAEPELAAPADGLALMHDPMVDKFFMADAETIRDAVQDAKDILSAEETPEQDPTPDEVPEPTPLPEPVIMNLAFSTSYISRGLDLSMLPFLEEACKGRDIRVSFEVEFL